MGKLNVLVLYDRWEEPEDTDASAGDKTPLVRTLDKKEVEDEVAETLGKLDHDAYRRTVNVLLKSGGEKVITRDPGDAGFTELVWSDAQ